MMRMDIDVLFFSDFESLNNPSYQNALHKKNHQKLNSTNANTVIFYNPILIW